MALNREWVLWNLREAKEELENTIAELEAKPAYGYGELSVRMREVYHHLNTAWNAREATEEQVHECSEENFDRWRQMPDDIMY